MLLALDVGNTNIVIGFLDVDFMEDEDYEPDEYYSD